MVDALLGVAFLFTLAWVVTHCCPQAESSRPVVTYPETPINASYSAVLCSTAYPGRTPRGGLGPVSTESYYFPVGEK
jgi:hypothetical protein